MAGQRLGPQQRAIGPVPGPGGETGGASRSGERPVEQVDEFFLASGDEIGTGGVGRPAGEVPADPLEGFLREEDDGLGAGREAGITSVDRPFGVGAAAARPATGGVHTGVGGIGENTGGHVEHMIGRLDQNRVRGQTGDMAQGAGGGTIGRRRWGVGGFGLGEQAEDGGARVREPRAGNQRGGPQGQGNGPGGPQGQHGGSGLACLDQVEVAVVTGDEQVDVAADTGEGVEEPDAAQGGAEEVGEAREFGVLGVAEFGFAADPGNPVRHQAALPGGPTAECRTPLGLANAGEEQPHAGQHQVGPVVGTGPPQAGDAARPALAEGEGVDPPVKLGVRDPKHQRVRAGGEAADAERTTGMSGAMPAVGGDERLEDPRLAAGLFRRGRRNEVLKARELGSGCLFGFARRHLAQGHRGEGHAGHVQASLPLGRAEGEGVGMGHVLLPL